MVLPHPDYVGIYYPASRPTIQNVFSYKGSTLLEADKFAHFGTVMLAEEKNYLGLAGQKWATKNREGRYRRCGVSPDINHQTLIHYVLQGIHDTDLNLSPSHRLLPKPHILKILAYLHDEGEDIIGFTEEALKQKLLDHINNIHSEIDAHNKEHPDIPLDYPTEDEIEQMRHDVPYIVKTFDILTKRYKGDPDSKDYTMYHRAILGVDQTILGIGKSFDQLDDFEKECHMLACALKLVDKAVNMATLSHRSPEMLIKTGMERELAEADYRVWIHKQLSKYATTYLNDNLIEEGLTGNFNALRDGGFINAIYKFHPQITELTLVMSKVMHYQNILYDHNLSNEGGRGDWPEPIAEYPGFQIMSLASSVDLLNLPKTRLAEVDRLDWLVQHGQYNPNFGMYNAPIANKASILWNQLDLPVIEPRPYEMPW